VKIKRDHLKSVLFEELSPWLIEQTEGALGEQVTFAEYTSENFDICPGAVTTFLKLKGLVSEDEEIKPAEEAMRAVDDLLGIEKDVMAKGFVTEAEFMLMLEKSGSARVAAGQLGAMIGQNLAPDFLFIGDHIIKVARMLEDKKDEG